MEKRREPIYKLAYKCSNPRCGGWRWRTAADARGETRCTKCFNVFAKNPIYKEVPQRRPQHAQGGGGKGAAGPIGGGGNPVGGKTTSMGGGSGRVRPKGAQADPNPAPTHRPLRPGLQPPQQQHLPPAAQRPQVLTKLDGLRDNYETVLRICKDPQDPSVVRCKQDLDAELQRQEDTKSPQERASDLKVKVEEARNVVGRTAIAVASAQRQAQAAHDRVKQLTAQTGDELEEVQRLELLLDKCTADLPRPTHSPTQEESPEERHLTDLLNTLMSFGNTSYVQQTVNEVQDRILRLGMARRLNTQQAA